MLYNNFAFVCSALLFALRSELLSFDPQEKCLTGYLTKDERIFLKIKSPKPSVAKKLLESLTGNWLPGFGVRKVICGRQS